MVGRQRGMLASLDPGSASAMSRGFTSVRLSFPSCKVGSEHDLSLRVPERNKQMNVREGPSHPPPAHCWLRSARNSQ